MTSWSVTDLAAVESNLNYLGSRDAYTTLFFYLLGFRTKVVIRNNLLHMLIIEVNYLHNVCMDYSVEKKHQIAVCAIVVRVFRKDSLEW